jgi:hypothetical protein
MYCPFGKLAKYGNLTGVSISGEADAISDAGGEIPPEQAENIPTHTSRDISENDTL